MSTSNTNRSNGVRHVNRTGASLSPALTAELLEGARETHPSAEGDGQELARVRAAYAAEVDPPGSIPPPATVKGIFKAAAKAMSGKSALVLTDKLGERLAFERSGVRLYDALLSKLASHGTWKGGPSREDLVAIRTEEHAHFTLVKQAIEETGGDPTAVTPSANLQAVASKGLVAVLSDPRTTLRDGLEAILVAELVDNDCWENLIDLASTLGHEELARRFSEALANEQEHLRRVRQWLGAALSGDAAGKLAAPFVERAAERQRRLAVDAEALDEALEEELRPTSSGRRQATRAKKGQPGRRSTSSGKRRSTSGGKPRPASAASSGRSSSRGSARPARKASAGAKRPARSGSRKR